MESVLSPNLREIVENKGVALGEAIGKFPGLRELELVDDCGTYQGEVIDAATGMLWGSRSGRLCLPRGCLL